MEALFVLNVNNWKYIVSKYFEDVFFPFIYNCYIHVLSNFAAVKNLAVFSN